MGFPLNYYDNTIGYVENFMQLMFKLPTGPYAANPTVVAALDKLLNNLNASDVVMVVVPEIIHNEDHFNTLISKVSKSGIKIALTPGETLTITIGAPGTAGTAGGSTIIFSSATSSNLLVLGGGGAAVTYSNGAQGGNGGYPNGSGGFAQTKSTGYSFSSGGCGKGTGAGTGQGAVVASFKLPGMGKFQSGAKSRGITPFMYGRGGRHDGTTPSNASAGFLIISWVE
jgi:hypothetical protein